DSTHSCPECDSQAHCDIAAGKETCWCFGIEPRDLPKPESDQLCLCRKCLEKKPVA
ncbi:cysteine-rich CWC family protein, partial [Vibrio parahaemolyticus]